MVDNADVTKFANYVASPLPPKANSPQCRICKGFLKSFKVAVQFQVWKDEDSCWEYECFQCNSQRCNISPGDAVQKILEQRPPVRTERERSTKFKEAMAALPSSFGFVGSNKAMKRIARSDLVKLFQPWKSLFRAKLQQHVLTDELLMKHAVLMTEINNMVCEGSHEKERLDGLLAEVAASEAEVAKASAPRAFASVAETNPELANQLRMASEYDDTWLDLGGSMYLKSWYVCDLLNCGAVMTSAGWRRKFESIYAHKQAWYCLLCGRRYRASGGQLCELKLGGGETSWTMAEVPCKSMEDIRAQAHEQLMGKVPTTADELFRQLKQQLPVVGTIASHVQRGDLYDPNAATWQEDLKAVVRIQPWARTALNQCPLFKWEHLIVMMGQDD